MRTWISRFPWKEQIWHLWALTPPRKSWGGQSVPLLSPLLGGLCLRSDLPHPMSPPPWLLCSFSPPILIINVSNDTVLISKFFKLR